MFVELLFYYLCITGSKKKYLSTILLQEMISISIYACFEILFIFSLFIMLLYACNGIEVNKILFTLNNTMKLSELIG